MGYEIYGEVEISKFNNAPGIPSLAKRYSRNCFLTQEEKEYLFSHRTFEHRQNNLLMDRFFDRLASAFSQADDRFAQAVATTWVGQDYPSFCNTQGGNSAVGVGPLSTTIPVKIFELVPGLIGLGYGTTLDIDKNNNGLESPFEHNLTGPNQSYNYRNTWNSKEGGTAPISANRDYFLLRCGSHWDDAWESRDPQIAGPLQDITEVGLFFNFFLPSTLIWWGPLANPLIDFTRGITPGNRAHEIVNVTAYRRNPGPNHAVVVLARADPPGAPVAGTGTYEWDESIQQLRYSGVLGFEPLAGETAAITFVPRYDHVGLVGGGSNNNFQEPPTHSDTSRMAQLFARVVLEEPFQKVNTETLTVTWLIYFRRVH